MDKIESMILLLKNIELNGLIEKEYNPYYDPEGYEAHYYYNSALGPDNTIPQFAKDIPVPIGTLDSLQVHDLVQIDEIYDDTETTISRFTVTDKGRRFISDPYGMKPVTTGDYLDIVIKWDYTE